MIKHIVFDLGGVIELIYPPKVIEAFEGLGLRDAKKIFTLVKQSKVCDDFEKGFATQDEFINNLRSLGCESITDQEIIDAWCMNQGGVNPETVTYLQGLAKQYPMSIVSNTNRIHYDYILRQFEMHHGFSLESLFENIYLSFQLGHRKPEPEIFQAAFSDINEDNINILYVDDLHVNCLAAEAHGVKSYLHPTNEALTLDPCPHFSSSGYP